MAGGEGEGASNRKGGGRDSGMYEWGEPSAVQSDNHPLAGNSRAMPAGARDDLKRWRDGQR